MNDHFRLLFPLIRLRNIIPHRIPHPYSLRRYISKSDTSRKNISTSPDEFIRIEIITVTAFILYSILE